MMSARRGPDSLSACEAARAIRAGDLDSETLVRACLERIASREPEVMAWAHLDVEAALAQARACDATPPLGPLHGVPIGVKDVIDVAGLPTGCGSPIHEGAVARVDASCVALARAAGAVILGKTHTAEFANIAPAPTRNPLKLEHTPGGSSSGSAAAVADAMVPLALGTQTVGSTIRPAAFCGIVGYKPSFGLINRAGLKFSAESFDTIGLMGRQVADVALLAQVLASVQPGPARSVQGLRIGLCLGAFRGLASAAARDCLDQAADRLREAGAILSEFEPPWADERLRDAHQTVMLHELARASLWEFHHHRDQLSERFRINVERGLAITTAQSQEARNWIAACRRDMAKEAAGLDGVLTFAAPGEAPEGLASTGDSVFNRIWTALAVPCLSLPAGQGARGLPLAVQWVGFEGDDAAMLAAAMAIEAVLAAP
jgi:Asp-tRNA(Asn)/Glu-tRNA(Gln) amidotransferase A subunit family amidase